MTGIVIAVIAIYAGITTLAFVFQRSLLYFPASARPQPADFGVGDMQSVAIVTADGLTLTAWYRRARAGRPTMVYFHGNAGHIGYRGAKVRPFLDAGIGVLLMSYRGYGGNPGRPTEAGLYRDGRAALDYLESQGVPPSRWVIYGESLGAGVAVEVAQNLAVRAVVLETPFTSVTDVAARHYWYLPVRWLLRDRYDSLAKIKALRAPLLVLLGGRDRVVPEKFGRRLFAAAPEPKTLEFYPDGGHDNLYDFAAAAAVIDFVNR